MGIADYLILAIIVAILGLSGWYIWRSKKQGEKCIGCPDSCARSSGNCSGGCSGCQSK